MFIEYSYLNFKHWLYLQAHFNNKNYYKHCKDGMCLPKVLICNDKVCFRKVDNIWNSNAIYLFHLPNSSVLADLKYFVFFSKLYTFYWYVSTFHSCYNKVSICFWALN